MKPGSGREAGSEIGGEGSKGTRDSVCSLLVTRWWLASQTQPWEAWVSVIAVLMEDLMEEKQATWLSGFTQLFLVCLGSQPLMISGQATPIQGGMASTQEEFISYRWVRLPLTTLPARDPVALTPRKHLISPVRWQSLA